MQLGRPGAICRRRLLCCIRVWAKERNGSVGVLVQGLRWEKAVVEVVVVVGSSRTQSKASSTGQAGRHREGSNE